MSEKQWIEHPRLYRTAKTWPTDPETVVQVKWRNGHVTRPAPVRTWRWWRFPGQIEPLPSDIVAWREV